MREATAWVAALVLVFHALVMATHIPAPLARVLAESAQIAMAGSICHSSAAPDASAASHANHDSVPDGTPGHVTYCPICLSLGGGSLFGPAMAPAPLPPVGIVLAAVPLPVDDEAGAGRPPRAFSARAPPVGV
ncbi:MULTISPECIES: DUF2946 family protein [Azospirillum]|uniref:DUF2946 family protein n=1 Tax=Azospirillum brasilense TaxID=192 RepID=A0ABU4P627_AZOBR|nr:MULTISPECIES: DUF2946 family protein [Azospirillum]ALJ34092.1 hypothetical protein AMK58_00935 [Azospirillum brasilense]MDW7552933.1 DUF2946 family protein [Azospirillum brasilense]MDW7591875.1 DUF2946 family protein [Azospirillum brasilense]MDW7627848.1 DUF2946 family protein [Azospirillum brasilense]MDX5952683.1 DUF2946 family protein [Azospirillum brasilense]